MKETKEVLKGQKALLLAEGCKLKKEIKYLEKRLEEIKKEISLDCEGIFINDAGDELVITKSERFTDISPSSVMKYLKENRMTNKFPECVKVQMTPLKKYVPISVIEKWRKPLDPIRRWTWK